MRIINVEKTADCLYLTTSDGLIKLEPFSDRVVRIVYTQRNQFRNVQSEIVLPECKLPADWNCTEKEKKIIFATPAIKIEIERENGAFTYVDIHDNILAREPERGGKTLENIDVVKNVFDRNETISSSVGVDGIRAEAREYRSYVDRQAYHAKLEFVWDKDEAIYGLGSHEEGMMNLRGQHQYLYQQNMKVVVPMLISTNGYGLLVDCGSLMTFHDDAFGSYLWSDVVEELDYYFIYGPDFDEIIGSYRILTGNVPMLPKWAFGYMQSKERYKSQEELIAIAKEFRQRNIPLDTIILDWQSWAGDLWGQKTLDPERFPDPEGMMRQLHEMNVRLMISIWPNMNAAGDNHREFLENGLLLGNQTHYDPFSQKGRDLYWQQAYQGLFKHGIDAWWCDCTEPFEADWRGPVKPEPEERMRINTEEAKKYIDSAQINLFSLYHSQGMYEGQRQVSKQKRVVNLTRSGYAGQHRYSTITWSGDNAANWETLRRQIPAGLNFCAAGEPYWTLDIGAFFVGGKNKWQKWNKNPDILAPWFMAGDYDEGCTDLGYREIYVRWFQYGAFLPVFRAHGTDTPREIWQFGNPGEIFYDTLIKFLNLRYRLIPYIYSLSGMVTHLDYTMMRALAFDFRDDANVYNIDDQYMFGPALMVCPVTKPMYYAAGSVELAGIPKCRDVYLPAGCDWYDFWTGQRFSGGQTIAAAASLEIMPLFVRAGSILPLGPMRQHTEEKPGDPLELMIYPGQDGEFMLYDDAGDGYGYEEGDFSFTLITWEDDVQKLTFTAAKGNRKPEVHFQAHLVSEASGADSNRHEQGRQIEYDGRLLSVELR